MPPGAAPSPGAGTTGRSRPGISVRDLTICIGDGARERLLVRDLDLSLAPGERLGVVGASGSGKSLTARAVLGLLPPSARVVSGSVEVDGVDMLSGPPVEVRSIRGGRVGVVLQDAGQAFNPVRRIGAQISETVRCHRGLDRRQGRDVSLDLLRRMGLEPAADFADAWVHQLSGGQAQRAMLALALAGRPRFLIADEPTTALDLLTQRRILDLLSETVSSDRLGLLLISHDLAVVAEMTDHVLVMDDGRVVDRGPLEKLASSPRHPASRRLVDAALRREAAR